MNKKPAFANIYWFPLACAYTAVILPWSVAAQFGFIGAPVGLQTAWGHGHEMLFGFALAVIAGYIAGPQPKPQVFAMVALWCAARFSFLIAPELLLTAILNIAFVLSLVAKLAPIFLRTAKKWRNKSVGLIILGLAISVIGFYGSLQWFEGLLTTRMFLIEAILLLSALMFFMGGRIIAPALAGHFQAQGKFLTHRVQPRFEGSILILLFVLLLGNFLPFGFSQKLMAGLLFIIALLTSIRMLRWRPWHCYNRPDLLVLLLGYAWVVIGWLLLALGLLLPSVSLTLALHALTVGALGTLTLAVMARGRTHRVLKHPNARPWLAVLPLLISVSAILRLTAPWFNYPQTILLASAFWAVAFAGLFCWLLWLSAIERKR